MIRPLANSVEQLSQDQAYLRVQADNLENRMELGEKRLWDLEEDLADAADYFTSLNTKHAALHSSVSNMDEELQRRGKSLSESKDELRKDIHYLWLSLVTTWVVGGLLLILNVLR